MSNLPARLLDSKGLSILEVMVAMVVFTTGILALTSAGLIAASQLRDGRADIGVAAAVRYQLEEILSAGYDGLTAGSDTVSGYPLSWNIQGTNPKKVVLLTQRKNWKGVMVADSVVTYVADPTPP